MLQTLSRFLDWAVAEDRRNLGYLFALEHGAGQVLDLDARYFPPAPWIPLSPRKTLTSCPPNLTSSYLPVTYPVGLAWPAHHQELSLARESVPASTVAVVHFLDDASLLTPPLLAVGLKTFVPMTGHSTLFLQPALWSLLLPQHPSPSSLRALLSQPLLWRLGLHTALGLSWTQAPNKTSGPEEDRSKLMQSLLDTDLTSCSSLPDCLVTLYSLHLPQSLARARAWLADLSSLGYAFPRLREHREFVYLTQGARLTNSSVPRLKAPSTSNQTDFHTLYLSFTSPPSGDLYFPNSSWQQGRNALLRLALALEVSPGYSYFIFTDEDVTLASDNATGHLWSEDLPSDPWLRLELFLTHFSPVLGFGTYKNWAQATNTTGVYSVTSTHDQCMSAFNRCLYTVHCLHSACVYCTCVHCTCVHCNCVH